MTKALLSVGRPTDKTPRSDRFGQPHIALSLDGVEIISNGSGSHHSLRKLDYRLELLRSATNKVGAPASASLTPAARC